MDDRQEPTILVDFQELYAALVGVNRLPSGRYPERRPQDAYAIPLVEATRQTIIRTARESDLAIITTNSDGGADRRAFLLRILGPGSQERVIDPGRLVVESRLEVNGALSEQCREAVSRWYSRR